MKALLEKLGRDPQRSLAIFLRGLGLFVIGLVFVALGYYQHHLWQIIGLVILALACLVAAWGYLGIFANRWLNMLSRHQPKNKNIKF
jgi:hypothetical protein